MIESQLDETNPASGWVCGPCFALVGSVPLVQPTAVRRDPAGYARKSIPVHADQVSKIKHVYEVRPRKDHRGFDLISDALPFGGLWYGEPNAVANAIGCTMHRSHSHDAVIRVYDELGNVIPDARAQGRFQRAVEITGCDLEQNKKPPRRLKGDGLLKLSQLY